VYISDLSVKNRVSVFVLAIMIVIFGLISYLKLPRESEPDVKIPYVFVSTNYRGVAPSDIETSITTKIEEKLKGVKNVKKIKSKSSEGSSLIVVEFVTGTNIDDAVKWVKDKVDTAKRELPSDLEDDPAVFEVDISEMPTFKPAVSGNMGLRELKEISRNIKDDIEAIPGVLEVELAGGREREIHVEVDPDQLAGKGIPFTSLYTSISSENQNVSGGNISMGDGRYQVRVPGEFKNIEEFKNLIVTVINGSPVYLNDIASISDSYKDITSSSSFNFKNSVNLYVKKRVGENIIHIVDETLAMLDKQQLPQGVKITKIMDRSKEVRMMVDDLENNIYTGLVLVIIVLMFSMGFRNAVLVSISIPLSMLLSFIALRAMGITLNMVTLFSLILALGMLVDNAIVIIENIYRFMSQGVPRIRAAMLATGEVAMPVVMSTLTTVVAFLPLLFWPGIMGEFMFYLPTTLITTLVSCLFVALIINPVFGSVFMKVKRHASGGDSTNAEEFLNAGEKPIQNYGFIISTYGYILRLSLNARFAVLATSILALVLCFCLWLYRTGIERPVEFFPSMNPTTCYVNIEPPEGTDMNTLQEIAAEVEKRIVSFDNVPEKFRNEKGKPPAITELQKKEFEKFKKEQGIENEKNISDLLTIRHVYTKLTSLTGGGVGGFEQNAPNHIGIQFHDFEGRVEPTSDTMDRLRARLSGIAGVNLLLAEGQHGPPTGPPINIEISGDNFAVLGMIAEKVKEVLKTVPHVKDIEDDYVKGTPNFEFVVDRKKAGLYGLTVGSIGSVIKTAINGWKVSTYREGNDSYDIVIKMKNAYRQDIDFFKKLFIPTMQYGLVPLADLITVNYTGGFGSINRINNQRVVTVKAKVDTNKIPGAVARAIVEKVLKRYELPAGYSVKFTGENQEQDEAQSFLSEAFAIALGLIFFVLVMQFNSVSHTLIIMTSVLLSFGGVFLGLGISNIPFGIIMTGIGVISLAGVVVNNAIVLLDYTNQLIERGYELTDAVVFAGQTRFRPVLLTAVTTVLGLIPMITGISYDFKRMKLLTSSESTFWWYSMAVVVAYGLAFATFLTLVVVPVIYHLIEDGKSRIKKLFS